MKLINPAQHKQLFLDDDAIESRTGVKRALHQPEKQGPVIRRDRSRQQTMVQSSSAPQWNPEKEVWEWWYIVKDHNPHFYDEVHYATSTDGLRWQQPSLGLYDWCGSKDNNIAYNSKVDFLRRRGLRNPVDIGERRLHHIIRDERDPDAQRRYKGLFSDEHNHGRYPAVSPDGFRWNFPHVPPIPSDDTASFIYDEIGDQYVATVKQRTEWGRSVWLSTSQDFEQWTEPKLILHTDEIDRENRRKRIRAVVEDPVYLSPPVVDDETDYIAQLYMMPLTTYEGLYIGFPLLFNPAGPDRYQANHVGINQVELAVSRDLYTWERVADRAVFIGIDPWDGTTHDTCQVALCGAPTVRENGEIWFYYEACRFRGTAEGYDDMYAGYFKDLCALALAKLRQDGFVSLDAEERGTVLTKPFILDGRTLHVNTEAQNGRVLAEILNAETMEPLPGLSRDECAPLSGDHLDGQLTWERGPNLVREGPVRVRFELERAKLYAFWLEQ